MFTLAKMVTTKRRSSHVALVALAEPHAKYLKKHAFSLAEKLWYLGKTAVAVVALVVSMDDPVAEDSDEEDELNDQPPIMSIQQAIQNLKEFNAYFDANKGK